MERMTMGNKLAYVGSKPGVKLHGFDRDSWYTPESYIKLVREALGGQIDFDPFSSFDAQRTISAKIYFTVIDDALTTPWPIVDTVFMNPPYSRGMINKCVLRFIEMFDAERFNYGIVLVNNATDVQWFHHLAGRSTAICFTDHRIAFKNTDGKKISNNTRGQCFLFIARNPWKNDTFKLIFDNIGLILTP